MVIFYTPLPLNNNIESFTHLRADMGPSPENSNLVVYGITSPTT